MHGDFLLRAGALLGALAVAGWLFARWRQSVIPAFVLLGLTLRPWIPESDLVTQLATIGVVLLLFFMGLEFSVGALLRDRRAILAAGGADLFLSFPVGLAAGLVLGVGWEGALILAGGFYISSSAIIAKSVIELRRAANPETPLVLGILVFEDLFISLFLAVLSGAVLAQNATVGAVVWGIVRAGTFFGGVMLLAHWGRRAFDALFAVHSDDVFVLMTAAAVILLSWGALRAGLSEALGGFMAGLLLSETRHKLRVERLFAPMQAILGAVFFFSFGLSIRLADLGSEWIAGIALVVLAVGAKMGAGWVAGRRGGLGAQGRVALGLTLLPRGEFSIILAGIALTARMPRVAALLAILVVALSLLGTTAIHFTPQLAARLTRRARRPRPAAEAPSPTDLV